MGAAVTALLVCSSSGGCGSEVSGMDDWRALTGTGAGTTTVGGAKVTAGATKAGLAKAVEDVVVEVLVAVVAVDGLLRDVDELDEERERRDSEPSLSPGVVGEGVGDGVRACGRGRNAGLSSAAGCTGSDDATGTPGLRLPPPALALPLPFD